MKRWEVKELDALSPRELCAIFSLRQRVFVVEQHCAYLDADGFDAAAVHLFCVDDVDGDNEVLAYARLFAPGVKAEAAAVVGRVVTTPEVRRTGLGRELMQRALAEILRRWGAVPIRLGAQTQLERFYESFGFVRDGNDYLEDKIPHLPMRRG